MVRALGTPNDPMFPQMWNLYNTGQIGGTPGADINAVQAWNTSTGSDNVFVATIDSGVDCTHRDLNSNVWTAAQSFTVTTSSGTVTCAAGSRGFNSVAGSCDPMDDNGHGTHVAGTIGAIGNNGVGAVGVNWTVQIVPCKFLNKAGIGYDSDAITCLDFVGMLKSSGANIVATNNSWGALDYSQALTDAILANAKAGILFIAAAGNEFSSNDLVPTYPANTVAPNVVAVAATTRTDALADFSNTGLHTVHLAAPGQEILSTLPNNTYGVESGTSMATPHVTGGAALLAASNSTLDWRAIRNLLLSGG